MAQPVTLRGSKLLIRIGNGASPELFTAPCALNSKSFNRTVAVNEFEVADCAEPDEPVWTQRVKSAYSSTISGSGVLAKADLPTYDALLANPDPTNISVLLDYDTAPIEYIGPYMLTTLNITGVRGEFVNVELEFVSSGEVALAA